MKKFFSVLLVSVFSLAVFAADVPAPAKAAPVTLSLAAENNMLKAENKLTKIISQETALQVKFQDLQNQAVDIKKQFAELQNQETSAKKDVDASMENAWKDSGLDKTKYDFDPANFTFSLKPEPKSDSKK